MLFLAGKIIEHIELNGRLSSKPCFDDTRGSVGSEVNPTALTGGTTGGTSMIFPRLSRWKCLKRNPVYGSHMEPRSYATRHWCHEAVGPKPPRRWEVGLKLVMFFEIQNN